MLDLANAWLLGQPTWAATLIIVGTVAVASVLGLLVFNVVVPHGLRSRHNDLAGFTLGPVGGVYAVLLAFIAVAVWDDFRHADALVEVEANLVANLYRDTIGLPDPPADELRHYLFVYAETVVQDEWPALVAGRVNAAEGWQLLGRFHLTLVGVHAAGTGDAAVEADMLRNLDELYNARRGRFEAATSNLPPILWWNLIAGGALVVVLSYFFGVPSLRIHAVMSGLLGASIALVLALIVLLQTPFRGTNHASAAPFADLVATVERMDYPHN